jgi:RimJ/RimL family protein N-acetyltransferase
MDTVRLHSGKVVAIRPIRPDDRLPLSAAYDRLSPESKYRRFLSAKPHLTSADMDYLVGVDGVDHVALIAVSDDDEQAILGVVRFVRLPEDSQMAEFAIVVGDEHQGQGLGTELLARLKQSAIERGITRFRATTLADNEAAHRLVHTLSDSVGPPRSSGPVHELEVDLAS